MRCCWKTASGGNRSFSDCGMLHHHHLTVEANESVRSAAACYTRSKCGGSRLYRADAFERNLQGSSESAKIFWVCNITWRWILLEPSEFSSFEMDCSTSYPLLVLKYAQSRHDTLPLLMIHVLNKNCRQSLTMRHLFNELFGHKASLNQHPLLQLVGPQEQIMWLSQKLAQ